MAKDVKECQLTKKKSQDSKKGRQVPCTAASQPPCTITGFSSHYREVVTSVMVTGMEMVVKTASSEIGAGCNKEGQCQERVHPSNS